MTLESSINDWTKLQLENVDLENIREAKIIRDAVLDTHQFSQCEINILDLPMLQRLRRISQTGLAYLTYPSATHNRFEHSLGVTILATKFYEALYNRMPEMIKPGMKEELRLAGLLHDVGHGPFSHSTEQIYKNFPEVIEVKNNKENVASAHKPHEIISSLIVSSPAFKDFFEQNICSKSYNLQSTPIDLKRVSKMIVGEMGNTDEAFLSDIINGAFDADKLDYLPRDCYFTGLKMDIDLDRIMHSLSIDKKNTLGKQGLMIDISGAPFIEQILFNKMMLSTSLYHHHKVRALECMLKGIFEACYDFNLKINGRSFKKVTDFLSVSDIELLTLEGKPDKIKPMIENIRNRDVLKRAVLISKRTIVFENGDVSSGSAEPYEPNYLDLLINADNNPAYMKEIRETIAQEINGNVTPYDIWIDLPPEPSFKEVSTTVIKTIDDKRAILKEIFRIDLWIKGYMENKWKGHIFCPPQYRKQVKLIAPRVLKEEFGIVFNEHATSLPD